MYPLFNYISFVKEKIKEEDKEKERNLHPFWKTLKYTETQGVYPTFMKKVTVTH